MIWICPCCLDAEYESSDEDGDDDETYNEEGDDVEFCLCPACLYENGWVFILSEPEYFGPLYESHFMSPARLMGWLDDPA